MRRIVTACGQKKPRRRTYFRQRAGWPQWRFDAAALAAALAEVHRAQATLQALTQEVITTSAIEGEALSREAVRSSIARRLGVDIGALAPADRHVDGVVDMVLDATQRFAEPLSAERLFGWHAALFPAGYSGRLRIQTGAWRNDAAGPMQSSPAPSGARQCITKHHPLPACPRKPPRSSTGSTTPCPRAIPSCMPGWRICGWSRCTLSTTAMAASAAPWAIWP